MRATLRVFFTTDLNFFLLVRDLLDLLVEAKQEVPDWLERAATQHRRGGGGRSGGRRFGGQFGSRDYRQEGRRGGGGGRSGGYNNRGYNNRGYNQSNQTSSGGTDWWAN